MKGEIIKIMSYNCQGLSGGEKRRDVLNYLKNKQYNIYLLQDTHFQQREEIQIRNQWGGECLFSSFSSNQRGVAILFNNNFEFVIHKSNKDENGNLLGIDITIEGTKTTLINLYGPNTDSPLFFDKVSNILNTYENRATIIAGDFNLVQDFNMDTSNYVNINNPRAREKILDLKEIYNLIDPFRELKPDVKRFTWRKKTPLKQARLDFFLLSDSMLNRINDVSIENSYRSDHSPVTLKMKINEFSRGKGLWKFNNSLLYDIEYVNTVKSIIRKVKEQYAVLVYNQENLDTVDDMELQLTIDDQLFLETLLLEIRGKTISYSSFKKKEKVKLEAKLIQDINILEENLQTNMEFDLIESKKTELRLLRKEKLKGHFVRSRTQWIEDGEKPTNYFCHLENRNYINKTIPKLIDDEGNCISDQKNILTEAKNFYQKLYKSRNMPMNEQCNLEEKIPFDDVPKLNLDQKSSLEGLITFAELTNALKKMKNNKSPGSDGFTTEFFKLFWVNIGKFIMRSINFGFSKGELSVTQKQGIITCIPKEGKNKQFMKNWRPISLLNTTYKLASSCIAERIKCVLEKLISTDQTGFIPGRYIGENIRIIYDIMHHTEKNDIPGILLLIDFEKAFDSISWTFLYKTLKFFNFGDSIIKWVETFYKNITSSVTQNSFLSDFFPVERGCRQGDPLSPYLFLLCAEILSILLKRNKDVKGITIDETEYLISQYADDTSLILDGSSRSLDASLRVLQLYADISGLKINLDKTNVIWIGSKKHSQDSICVKWGLKWGSSTFTLLGIKFSVDLEEMIILNYKSRLKEIENTLQKWSKQTLTPLGKITIIKTLLISKLNYLFLTLPNPDDNWIYMLNTKLYDFIWDNKRDKVKRELLCQDYSRGGLKMINLNVFIMGLKLTWIRRLFTSEAKWVTLVKQVESINLNEIAFHTNIKQTENKFWNDVLKAWRELKQFNAPSTEPELLSSSLWQNPFIRVGNTPIYYKTWAKKGVCTINDLVNEEGSFMSLDSFRGTYNIATNFLTYNGVLAAVKGWLKKIKINISYKLVGPIQPFNLQIFFKSKKGSKDMYNVLNKYEFRPKAEQKWGTILNNQNINWLRLHSNSLKYCTYTKYKWFQYRINHMILATNASLFKMGKKETDQCTFCNEQVETLEHIFWGCHKVNELWVFLNRWIFEETNIEIPLNLEIVLFGSFEKNTQTHNVIRNKILVLTKYYIYRTKLSSEELNNIGLKHYVVENLTLEKQIFSNNNSQDKLNKYWSPWNSLLE